MPAFFMGALLAPVLLRIIAINHDCRILKIFGEIEVHISLLSPRIFLHPRKSNHQNQFNGRKTRTPKASE